MSVRTLCMCLGIVLIAVVLGTTEPAGAQGTGGGGTGDPSIPKGQGGLSKGGSSKDDLGKGRAGDDAQIGTPDIPVPGRNTGGGITGTLVEGALS